MANNVTFSWNVDSTTKTLPSTYNKGQFYFDDTTNKLYLDKGTTAADRITINAAYADNAGSAVSA